MKLSLNTTFTARMIVLVSRAEAELAESPFSSNFSWYLRNVARAFQKSNLLNDPQLTTPTFLQSRQRLSTIRVFRSNNVSLLLTVTFNV